MPFSDYFDRQMHLGNTSAGAYLGLGNVTSNIQKGSSIGWPGSDVVKVFDAAVDEVWAKGARRSRAPHQYFDYYFAGQDMLVYIDGVEDDPEFSTIPILEMGFNVEQQKMPVYGFWDYTYSGVMRGNRIVTGAFTIATKSPDYMTRLLEKAAQARANQKQSYYYHRGLTEDDENIQKYWSKNLDPSLQGAGKNLFSVHPPFSFVIIYGVQNLSLQQMANSSGYDDLWHRYQEDNPLASDINERMVESDPLDQSSRIILDACELNNIQISYTSDGTVCAETYQFFARDKISSPRRGNNLMLPTSTVNVGDPGALKIVDGL
jgi:hypothetical protein